MVSLKDLSELNLYVKIENSFFRKMLEEICGGSPISDRGLSEKLGIKFSEKYGRSLIVCGWYYEGKCIPTKKLSAIVNLSKKYSWKDVESNIIGITTSGHGRPCFIRPRFPIEMDEFLGSLAGHILGDGSIDKRYSQVFFSNTNKQLLKEFIENMRTVFGAEPRIWVQKSGGFKNKSEWLHRTVNTDGYDGSPFGLFYPSSIGIILNFMLDNFAFGKAKLVTERIKNSNNNFRKAFIRAFFDDEGSIVVESQTLRVFQDSSNILTEIKKILSDLGIESNPIHHYYKHGKKRHYFNITGLINYKNFYQTIGFTSNEKCGKLAVLIANTDVKGKRKLTKGKSKEIIRSILERNSPRTADNIAKALRILEPDIGWNINTVYKHLILMREFGILEFRISDRDNKTHLWYLK